MFYLTPIYFSTQELIYELVIYPTTTMFIHKVSRLEVNPIFIEKS